MSSASLIDTRSAQLVERSSGHRHALIPPPMAIPRSMADPDHIHHSSVIHEGYGFKSAGGGVADSPEEAAVAAAAEALERYCASEAVLPHRPASELGREARRIPLAEWALHSGDQRADPGFPVGDSYPEDPAMTRCYSLLDNEPVWLPTMLVTLSPHFGALSTSSGLAADPHPHRALLRGLQELIERDAYMTTWMHQLGGRLVHRGPADARLGGDMRVFDITPAYSPHPVAAVSGTLFLEGRPRHSLGLACRSTWEAARAKATNEFLQGTLFVGHHLNRNPGLYGLAPEAVTGFDEHAVYYGANPDQWERLPLHRYSVPACAPADQGESGPSEELRRLVARLDESGVRTFYRDLTLVDINQLGLRVVRVASPDLTPIHHDHRFPFLGGRASDVKFRYPDADERRGGRTYPSPFPHALG